MNYISNAMFWLSNGLLVPVIIVLLYLFLRAILLLGTLLGTWQKHRKIVKYFTPTIENADKKSCELLQQEIEAIQLPAGFIYVAKNLFKLPSSARNLLISEYELSSHKKMSVAQILIKFGPIFGLMGTLIPMGPALVGLAQGDISNMAYNMQVAFATTVLGLFAAAVGFAANHLMQTYMHRCLIWLDYINDRIDSEEENNGIKQ